ncbi:hypothetical protein B0O99DRAFT_380324, partial [Bisporella sp. PMI_857]
MLHTGSRTARATSEKTFAKMVDKVYEAQNREWPVVAAEAATCHYWFASPRLGSWEEKSAWAR